MKNDLIGAFGGLLCLLLFPVAVAVIWGDSIFWLKVGGSMLVVIIFTFMASDIQGKQ